MKIFLYFTLTFFIAFFGCKGNREQKLILNSTEIISYLPEETNYILSVNLNNIYKAGYGEYLVDSPIDANSGWLSRFMHETDFKLAGGISSIIKTDSWKGKSLFILFFDKNISRVEDHLQDKFYFEKINNEDLTLYKSKLESIFISIYDNILISGDRLSVIYLTSNLKNEKRKLNRLSERINFKDNEEYWFWADQPGYAFPILNLLDLEIPDSTEIISEFESMKLGVKFGDGILINSYLDFAKESAAGEFNQLFLKRSEANIGKDEQDFHSDLNIMKDDMRVSISLNLTNEIIEKLKHN